MSLAYWGECSLNSKPVSQAIEVLCPLTTSEFSDGSVWYKILLSQVHHLLLSKAVPEISSEPCESSSDARGRFNRR